VKPPLYAGGVNSTRPIEEQQVGERSSAADRSPKSPDWVILDKGCVALRFRACCARTTRESLLGESPERLLNRPVHRNILVPLRCATCIAGERQAGTVTMQRRVTQGQRQKAEVSLDVHRPSPQSAGRALFFVDQAGEASDDGHI
jgi:hypothetical protein